MSEPIVFWAGKPHPTEQSIMLVTRDVNSNTLGWSYVPFEILEQLGLMDKPCNDIIVPITAKRLELKYGRDG